MENNSPRSQITQPSFLPEIWRIKAAWPENADTVTLAIRPEGRSCAELTIHPGQFNMLYVFGIGEIPISISSIQQDCWHHTIRCVGSVSKALAALKAGDALGLRGPFGQAWPKSAVNTLLIAGGLGLAPLKPVIEQQLANSSTQAWLGLVYGMRNPDQLLFQEDLKAWRAAGLKLYLTVDRANKDWQEHIGVVTSLLDQSMLPTRDTQALICGPEMMMKFTADKLVELGQPQEQIYLSMERNMKCALGFCGHCQYAEDFVCRRGPIYSYAFLAPFLRIREL